VTTAKHPVSGWYGSPSPSGPVHPPVAAPVAPIVAGVAPEVPPAAFESSESGLSTANHAAESGAVIDVDLPETVGRVLGLDERPRPVAWLVDGLVADAGFTAIALPDRPLRTAAGVEVVRGLLASGGSVLGRTVLRSAGTVLVLATSTRIAQTYRAVFAGDGRVAVAAVRPWDGESVDYWPALYRLAAGFEVVVVDMMQDLANGSLTWQHNQHVDAFASPCVGLYAGYETKPGIAGGDGGWSFAAHRFWYDAKLSLLRSLDTSDAPWRVDFTPVAVGAAVAGRLHADQVRQLGALARRFDQRGGLRVHAGELLNDYPDEVTAICGRQFDTVGELVREIDAHRPAWDGGLSGRVAASALPDELPF
jgi:hypothetical protein